MGTFLGHTVAGCLFLYLGVWWMAMSFPGYIRAKKNRKEFVFKLSYHWPGKPNLPVESLIKCVVPFLGVIVEWAENGSFVQDGKLVGMSHLQHMGIYSLFFLHGLIDLALHYGAPLPKDMDRLTIALAFAWYGRFFVLHEGKEKTGMETMMHILPTSAMYLVAAAFTVEMVKPSWILVHVTRIYGVLVLGTWFIQTSAMMYLPTPFPGNKPNLAWDRDDVETVKFMLASFGLHLNLHLIFVALFYLLIAVLIKSTQKDNAKYQPLELADKSEELEI